MAEINYINHHKNVNAKMISDESISTIDIAIYNALFLLWNSNGFCTTLSINRSEVMQLSKVGNANTYTKSLKRLHSLGYINYMPSNNPLIGSKVTIIRFDISGGKSSDISGGKSSDNTTDTSSGTSGDTLYKHYNTLTQEHINTLLTYLDSLSEKEIESKIAEFIKPSKKFDFKKSLIEYGLSEKLATEYMKVRKDKKASNTETALNSILKEIEKSGKHIDECIEICIINSWKGFKAEWINNQSKTFSNGKSNTNLSANERHELAKAELAKRDEARFSIFGEQASKL